MPHLNLITPMSSNVKLGVGVATSYRPVGDSALNLGSCPSSCPLLGNGCYTRKYHVNMLQSKSKLRHDEFSRFLEKDARFVRLHTSGDFFVQNGNSYSIDLDYFNDLIAFAASNEKVTFFTYTHDIGKFIELGITYNNGSFPGNFHLVASVDSDSERELAKTHGFRTARVIVNVNDKANGETLCPYDYYKHTKNKKKISCVNCQLCFNHKHKNDIAFMKH